MFNKGLVNEGFYRAKGDALIFFIIIFYRKMQANFCKVKVYLLPTHSTASTVQRYTVGMPYLNRSFKNSIFLFQKNF